MKLIVFLLPLLFLGGNELSVNVPEVKSPVAHPSPSKPVVSLPPNDVGELGQVIDRYNGIPVYYNGKMSNVFGRNVTHDGYNLGLKYQCVEYVKRYYYYRLGHKMPDSYGHAKEFYDKSLSDAHFNQRRGLRQFKNGSKVKPRELDILVFDGDKHNPFGHVGLVTKVTDDTIEIIQQNVGKHSRATYKLYFVQGRFYIGEKKALGWLRKTDNEV